MEKTKMVEELLSCGRNVLRELHNAYGFDWEKPLYVFKFDKPFTLGFARKLAAYNGFGDDAKKVFCARFGVARPWLVAIEFIMNDVFPTASRDTLPHGVQYFSYKSEFTKARKREDDSACVYLICQKPEFVKAPKPSRVFRYGWTERYKPNIGRYEYFDEYGCCYYTRAQFDFCGKPINGFTADFDRSGYCVGERRDYLNGKARELHAKREAAAVDYEAVKEQYEALREAVARRKEELVDMLTKATTPEEFKEVAKALQDGVYDKGYASSVNHLEWFKERMDKHSFSGVNDVQYHYHMTARNLKMA